MRKGEVRYKSEVAGYIYQDDSAYKFEYLPEYLSSKDAMPISLTLPLSNKTYESNVLFPFFDGLIPEGWLLDIAEKNWKLNPRDRMGLLLKCCEDCIGAVSVFEVDSDE